MPRQEVRVGDRCCWLDAVEVGEEAVGWEMRLVQVTVLFPHGKLCREVVH